MFAIRKKILLSGVISLLLLGYAASAKTLDEEIYEVDRLRTGFDTPFDEVEKRCNELLQKYTKPDERGKIYFELAQVEGQSGLQRPNKLIEYVKKALEYPLDPLKKVRLYIYWGDAIQVVNRGVHNQELVIARRKAVRPYLEGLKETLKYDLPERKPDLPGVDRFRARPGTEAHRRLMLRHQEQVEARKKAKFQRAMIQHRDILTSQVSSMYSRFPWASDEIRELATKILEDEAAVERLMSAVDEAVQKRVEELGWEPQPPDNSHPKSLTHKDKTTAIWP